jgi:hypothetical protein
MNIHTTIPDKAIPAWQYRVDQFNAGSNQPPVDIEGFAQINRDGETEGYAAAYAAYQLTLLVPLGDQFNAAPTNVQDQVKALLAPYNS